MNAAFQALMFLILVAISGAVGFFGRGWYDGTLIQRSDADLIAQGRVDESARAAVLIKTATDAKEAALRKVQAPARIVSYECAPGAGAVSDDALARLKAVSK